MEGEATRGKETEDSFKFKKPTLSCAFLAVLSSLLVQFSLLFLFVSSSSFPSLSVAFIRYQPFSAQQ